MGWIHFIANDLILLLKIVWLDRFMFKRFYILFLVLTGLHSHAQTLFHRQADSLTNCGYFQEELVYRKKILESTPKNSGKHRAAKVMYDIAEMNILQKALEKDKADSRYEAILKFYQTMPDSEKKAVEVEIDRLKANKLSAEEKYDEAISLLKQTLKKVPPKSAEAAEIEFSIGQTYKSNYNYYEAIKHIKKAIGGFERLGWRNHYVTALAYSELAFCYDDANTEKEMMPTFEKALEIWTKFYAADGSIVSVAYNDAIFSATEYGDLKKLAEYQKRYDLYMQEFLNPANTKKYKSESPFSRYRAEGMYHLSSIRYYSEFFDETKLMYHLKAQERVFARAPQKWAEKEKGVLLSSYDGAAYAFYMNYQSEKALYYNSILEKLAYNDFYKMKVSANRAMLYYYKYDYNKSLINNQKALDYLQLLGFKSSYLTLLTLKAENLANLGKFNEAKTAVKEVFHTEFDKDIPLEKIRIQDFGEVNNSAYINIFIHSGLAYRRIYERNGRSKTDLKVIRNLYKLAADMFKDYYQKGFFNPDLEQQLNNIKEGLLFSALQTPADKTYLAQCINTLEDISSQHLWKQFLAKYSNNLNLSKDLISKRNEAVIELSYLTQKEEKTLKEIQREKSLNAALDAIDHEISKSYPNYERFQAVDFNIETLQQSLGSQKTLVKYYVSDSSVFACKIVQKTLEIYYLGKSNELKNLSKVYHSQISQIDFGYKNNSKKLFKLLLKPLNLADQRPVVFVPENFLNFCPFETLLNEKDMPFALSHIVSYSNSLKFSQPLFPEKKASFDNFLTGFAPKYQDGVGVTRSDNGQLIYTGAELKNIADIFRNSALFMNENATKSNFLKTLGSSNVHHLAMHSILDEKDYEYSSLVFQNNEKMHFYELYALNFPSEMVVLSACNTGVGEYLNGEGLMSISRALNYAGVKSTVNSLWQVPDKETSELMSYFYHFLKEGISKDLALVKAKREFIHKNPMKSHPYYWSGFIINGDVTPLTPRGNQWLYWLGFAALLATSGAVIYIKKRQISKPG